MSENSFFSKNIAVGIIFIVIALFFFYNTFGLSPQNSAFPRSLSFFLFILGVITLIQGIRTGNTTRKDKPINFTKILAVIAVMSLYLLLLEEVGFVLCTTVLIPIISFLLGYRKIIQSLIGSIGFSILIFVLFNSYLSIPLPRGILFFPQ